MTDGDEPNQKKQTKLGKREEKKKNSETSSKVDG